MCDPCPSVHRKIDYSVSIDPCTQVDSHVAKKSEISGGNMQFNRASNSGTELSQCAFQKKKLRGKVLLPLKQLAGPQTKHTKRMMIINCIQ